MTDDVLCVRVSPNGRLLAAALLDSTVRVFFADSLKFFLSLYGHKLPVLCMDISSGAQRRRGSSAFCAGAQRGPGAGSAFCAGASGGGNRQGRVVAWSLARLLHPPAPAPALRADSTLLVTGSADKNIKIWGLDFGDCHRSLHAHADSVMAAAFVPGTHYLFTAGKDRTVKYWDADKFEHLLTLQGHCAEVGFVCVCGGGGRGEVGGERCCSFQPAPPAGAACTGRAPSAALRVCWSGFIRPQIGLQLRLLCVCAGVVPGCGQPG
jgi:hypothetical protein